MIYRFIKRCSDTHNLKNKECLEGTDKEVECYHLRCFGGCWENCSYGKIFFYGGKSKTKDFFMEVNKNNRRDYAS